MGTDIALQNIFFCVLRFEWTMTEFSFLSDLFSNIFKFFIITFSLLYIYFLIHCLECVHWIFVFKLLSTCWTAPTHFLLLTAAGQEVHRCGFDMIHVEVFPSVCRRPKGLWFSERQPDLSRPTTHFSSDSTVFCLHKRPEQRQTEVQCALLHHKIFFLRDWQRDYNVWSLYHFLFCQYFDSLEKTPHRRKTTLSTNSPPDVKQRLPAGHGLL